MTRLVPLPCVKDRSARYNSAFSYKQTLDESGFFSYWLLDDDRHLIRCYLIYAPVVYTLLSVSDMNHISFGQRFDLMLVAL